jgi:hypothetical protein
MRIETHGDLQVQYLDVEGAVISTSEDTSDLIGNAWMDHADVIAVPVARLDPAFFDLSSLFAGDVTQKIVNYHLRLAIIGDVSAYALAGSAFEAFVAESNRGDHIWFLENEAALAGKLDARG